MAARTFTQPSSLNGTLAVQASHMSTSEVNGSVRSEASAKESQASFPSEVRDPLGHHKNPNSKPGITFAHQDKLPKLPIPELDSSCKKYLAALKPLQTPKEHHDTVMAIQDFMKSDGPALQDKLNKYASGKANYIEQFCEYLYHNIEKSCRSWSADLTPF
ncbi:carnitine O-acetyltransferase yat1 [Kalmusia sp. IMI 367209]|nr:carnitine O-acetyltransferase yat1 [Kalmusia sp. IMI 367209]